MEELLITIMLLIPAPQLGINWTINEVPTQIQIIHKSGLEVSYNAITVPCTSKPRNKKEMIFRAPMDQCYSVFDLSSPSFVRHPSYWYPVKSTLEE